MMKSAFNDSILVFAGTRPEIIKMAPLVRELRARHVAGKLGRFKPHFCFSGQHFELARPFLGFFGIEPDSTLNLMEPGQSLGQLTSRASAQFDALFSKNGAAAAALVQGDTTTAFVASLISFYHRIPVGHVEAGLRTSSIDEPFPEELNRRLIGRVASWHYAPTSRAAENLEKEGVSRESLIVTGNTGIDALLWASERVKQPSAAVLRALEGKRLVLVTAHRRENIGRPLENICSALAELARRSTDVNFVLPVHKNPKIAETIHARLSAIGNVLLTDPLEYGDLAWTMRRAELVLSDSGGIQEEAPTFKKPVLVLRNETERPEAVEYGTSIIVGSDEHAIVSTAEEFLSGQRSLSGLGAGNPYGDGAAAVRIVDHLLQRLSA